MSYTFIGNCAALEGDAINDMKRGASRITRRRLLALVGRERMADMAAGLGYAARSRDGLTMAADWHVSYHVGHYAGAACCFFTWSAFEYVFTQEGA